MAAPKITGGQKHEPATRITSGRQSAPDYCCINALTTTDITAEFNLVRVI
jgi:hypothetical protein